VNPAPLKGTLQRLLWVIHPVVVLALLLWSKGHITAEGRKLDDERVLREQQYHTLPSDR
jgi:hypothetical protein